MAGQPMEFIWPMMLWSFLLVPPLILLYIWNQQRRKRIAALYGSFGFLQEATGRKTGSRRHIPPSLFLISLLILIFSLARPQMEVNLPSIEGTIILAFDVSGSMAADDMKPTRMEAAKSVARDFVQRQPASVQIGVVAFSDSGFSVLAPTNDQEAILAAINRLKPERGTSLANGILVSLNTIATQLGQPPILSNDEQGPELPPDPEGSPSMPPGSFSPAVILLLTDGENTVSPDPLEAVQTAVDRGVRIHTIGIGSPTGTILEINDFTVHTQLDEAMLKQISQVTSGTYYNAVNEQDLRTIYENIDLQLVVKQQHMEVTSILAGISLITLLIGGTLSLLWFSRVP